MKRTLLFASTALLSATTAFATTQSDTLIVENPTQVAVINNDSSCIVTIQGKEGNPDFSYRQVVPFSANTPTIINESETEWNFKMPFINTSKSQNSKTSEGKTVKKHKWENERKQYASTIGLFGIGVVSSLNTPSNMHTETQESFEVMGPRIMWSYRPRMSRFSYGIGFSTSWKKFRMTEDVQFKGEANGNTILTNYPQGAQIGFSRLKVHSWNLPLEVKYDLTDYITLSGTGIVSYNHRATLKTCYTTAEGEGVKERTDKLHINPITFDLMGQVKFGGIGLYVKYSPCNVFESGKGPKFQSWSTGITFGW